MYIRDLSAEKPKTVVLIHGQGLGQDLYDEVIPSLDARLLLPDLPGHGLSMSEPVPPVSKVQEKLEAALAARHAPELHLVGYSIGAHHALALALRGALPIRSLVLLGPMLGAEQAVLQALAGYATAIESGQLSWVDAMLDLFFAPEFRTSHPARVAWTRARLESSCAQTLIAELRHMLDLEDLRPRLRELRLPVLIRVGDCDQRTSVSAAREMAKALPSSQLEIVPGVGHHILGADLEGTVASLKRFLAV